MKIGFFTNAFTKIGIKDLTYIADWAIENGFEELEVGPDIELDDNVFNDILKNGKIAITALTYCNNFLDENEEKAIYYQQQLKRRIEFASRFSIPYVVCTTGIPNGPMNIFNFDPEKSMDAVVELYKDFVEMAEKKDVYLAFETIAAGNNIAMSPYMLDLLFKKIGSTRVGINFDPSHMIRQFINPHEIIYRFSDRIFRIHVKDTEINYKELGEIGIYHRSKHHKWWRARLPGHGDLDWNKIIRDLYEIRFNGTLSIENEDELWGWKPDGTEEVVKKGLLQSKKYIKQFLIE